MHYMADCYEKLPYCSYFQGLRTNTVSISKIGSPSASISIRPPCLQKWKTKRQPARETIVGDIDARHTDGDSEKKEEL